jgi:hypothetical protein
VALGPARSKHGAGRADLVVAVEHLAKGPRWVRAHEREDAPAAGVVRWQQIPDHTEAGLAQRLVFHELVRADRAREAVRPARRDKQRVDGSVRLADAHRYAAQEGD